MNNTKDVIKHLWDIYPTNIPVEWRIQFPEVDCLSDFPHFRVTISVYDTEMRNIYSWMASFKAMQLTVILCTLEVVLSPCFKTSTTFPRLCSITVIYRGRPSVDDIMFEVNGN